MLITPEIPMALLPLKANFYRRNPATKDWAPYATLIPAYLGNNRPMSYREVETGEIIEDKIVLITRYNQPGGGALVPKVGDRVTVGDRSFHVKSIINAETLGHHNEIELTELDQSGG